MALIFVVFVGACDDGEEVGPGIPNVDPEYSLHLLDAVVHSQVARGDSPWGIAHALLAFGPELKLDEEKALDVLKREYLLSDPARFPLHGKEPGSLGEVHPHLVLKTLAELDVESPVCLDLVTAAVQGFTWPTSYEEWNDSAWLLEACVRLTLPKDELIAGRRLDAFAAAAFEELWQADELVRQLLDEHGVEGFRRPSATGGPDECGVWAYTCGGQHLLQGLVLAYRGGYLSKQTHEERMKETLETFLRRIDGESAFRAAEKKRALDAGKAPLTVECRTALPLLKLYGHALETLHRARGTGLLPEADLQSKADDLVGKLRRLVEGIDELGDLGEIIDRVHERDISQWYLWYGDGCHAVRGLKLWGKLP